MQSLNYEITTLENGIRVITETVNHVQFMSMGFWVGVGSRYENEQQWGITHFIEHMLFKGTDKRTAEQISGAVDAVGGQLNAFTSKENTCYYIKTLTEDFPLAVDVLSDMFLNSRFDNEEIAKEREVIIEEIKMYEDIINEVRTKTKNAAQIDERITTCSFFAIRYLLACQGPTIHTDIHTIP